VVARANVPITSDPLGDDRPFLGGSPRQIADDIAKLAGQGIDHVLFSNVAARELDEQIRLLDQLKAAVS
jgi:alkanesulfonate monooxygenase SsuD/methylene tetrahydromethanopterin reductase-like flavin-dependent oxidoreductase (luciferase family)